MKTTLVVGVVALAAVYTVGIFYVQIFGVCGQHSAQTDVKKFLVFTKMCEEN